ncbi:MAG: hypothetical protein ACYCO9_21990 [Streptosporangiaceae bacterium]
MIPVSILAIAPRTGIWPDGEPRTVRDAADQLEAAKKAALAPRNPEASQPAAK